MLHLGGHAIDVPMPPEPEDGSFLREAHVDGQPGIGNGVLSAGRVRDRGGLFSHSLERPSVHEVFACQTAIKCSILHSTSETTPILRLQTRDSAGKRVARNFRNFCHVAGGLDLASC